MRTLRIVQRPCSVIVGAVSTEVLPKKIRVSLLPIPAALSLHSQRFQSVFPAFFCLCVCVCFLGGGVVALSSRVLCHFTLSGPAQIVCPLMSLTLPLCFSWLFVSGLYVLASSLCSLSSWLNFAFFVFCPCPCWVHLPHIGLWTTLDVAPLPAWALWVDLEVHLFCLLYGSLRLWHTNVQ